jgi:hypothetical protein
LPRDLGQGAVLKEDGTERFVASVQGWGGMSEEVVAEGVVHGATSEIVMGFFGESLSQGNAIARRVDKTWPGQESGNARISGGTAKERSWTGPGLRN